jgi:hypothetical protein
MAALNPTASYSERLKNVTRDLTCVPRHLLKSIARTGELAIAQGDQAAALREARERTVEETAELAAAAAEGRQQHLKTMGGIEPSRSNIIPEIDLAALDLADSAGVKVIASTSGVFRGFDLTTDTPAGPATTAAAPPIAATLAAAPVNKSNSRKLSASFVNTMCGPKTAALVWPPESDDEVPYDSDDMHGIPNNADDANMWGNDADDANMWEAVAGVIPAPSPSLVMSPAVAASAAVAPAEPCAPYKTTGGRKRKATAPFVPMPTDGGYAGLRRQRHEAGQRELDFDVPHPVHPPRVVAVGDAVRAYYHGDGKYYDAIAMSIGETTIDVTWADGDTAFRSVEKSLVSAQ